MTLPGVRYLDSQVQMPMGLVLPVRSVVFELTNARVLLGPGTLLTREQLQSAGEVTDIVATSLTHASGVKQAAQVHPGARLWGPAGVQEKNPDVAWQKILGRDPWPYEDELQHLAIGGQSKLNESVFLHRASKALYASDLVFNITQPKGLAAALIFRLFGTHGRFAVSRLFLRYVDDKPAFVESMKQLLQLDFDHLIPSHGETELNDARQRLKSALIERKIVEQK